MPSAVPDEMLNCYALGITLGNTEMPAGIITAPIDSHAKPFFSNRIMRF